MILQLVQIIGIRRLSNWALWLLRALAVLVLAAIVITALLVGGWPAVVKFSLYGTVGLVLAGIQALWKRRRRESEPLPEAGPRTIDGKVVPEKLAMAALAVPLHSSDGEFVQRSLPDYGKALLNLDASEFAYIAQPSSVPAALLSSVQEPAVKRSQATMLRWGLATAAAVLIIIGGVLFRWYTSPEHIRNMIAERVAAQAMNPEPVIAAQEKAPIVDGPLSTPVPATLSEAAPPAQAPATAAAPNSVSSEQGSFTGAARFFSKGNDAAPATLSRPAEDPAGTWRDPSSGLLWRTRDNGNPIPDWQKAKNYCASMDWYSVTGWRMPTYSEEFSLWDKDGTLRGGIQPDEKGVFFWSSTIKKNTINGNVESKTMPTDEAGTYGIIPIKPDGDDFLMHGRVLCVHD